MSGGLHSQLKLLRFDFAGKIGLEPAPCNSLRALRPLRSTMHGEHETNALKRSGSRPIFPAALRNRPRRTPPAAMGTLLVFDQGRATTARES
jgi:hypothetical protein